MIKENEEILEKYRVYLRRTYPKSGTKIAHTQRNYHRFVKQMLLWIEEHKSKAYGTLTRDDVEDYRVHCMEHYKINGNVGRLSAVNNFNVKFLGRKALRVKVPNSVKVEKPILGKNELLRYQEGADTPLERLITIYQVDGHLRPEDLCRLRISWHDFANQELYTNEAKSGDDKIAISPRMKQAFREYMPYRVKPKREIDQDRLIIIPHGSHYGLAPVIDSDFIWRITKKIAARAGLNYKNVYPYLIKPSAITDKFNDGVNPEHIRLQSRHKRIETTLRYNHSKLESVKDYFNRTQRNVNYENLDDDGRARVLLNKFLNNEFDLKTFKMSIDVLYSEKDKNKTKGLGVDIGYV